MTRNPHAVVLVDDLAHVGDLREAPVATPPTEYPAGVTVEFVTVRGPRHLALRIHERGVGETRACGTGACAAVAALRHCRRQTGAADYTIGVPGGRLHVAERADGSMELNGPAVIVAR